MSQREDDEYTLGTGDDELARLAFQHRLWSPVARDLWERAGITWGDRVLDLGAGPGYAAADLAVLTGSAGRVHAVDKSARFVEACRDLATRSHLPIDAFVGDLTQGLGSVLGAFEGTYDAAWLRWVLCFVEEPEQVIHEAVRALKPGGTLILQDYFNYQSMRLCPPTPSFEPVREAIVGNWRRTGGDPDVAGKAVLLCQAAGLVVEHVGVIARVARPQDTLWRWPGSYFRNFLPKLVEEGDLEEADRAAFVAEWERRSETGEGFFYTPPMLGVVAKKPA